MGSGKDTVGALLSMLGYRRLALADAVKHEVAFMAKLDEISWPDVVLVNQNLFTAMHLVRETPDLVWQKPTLPMIRSLLQQWGTEYRREQDENYWIDLTLGEIAVKGNGAVIPYVITDVRFPNEAQAIRNEGGVIWRIERPGTEVNNHISEYGVDQIVPDVVIENDGDLHKLANKVRRALAR